MNMRQQKGASPFGRSREERFAAHPAPSPYSALHGAARSGASALPGTAPCQLHSVADYGGLVPTNQGEALRFR